uniref:Odorant binding protein n=1 Tax=Glyphodes pyloalis TaxID=1242752 RepID=A0A6M3GRV1_GLYPY|nr:odorant binding protein [Glyphodes pyloalis]
MFKTGICVAMFVSILEFATCLSDDNKLRIQSTFVSAGEKCVTEHPITEEDITAFKERRFPESTGAACFSACVLTQIGLLDDKGAISATTALEKAKTVFDSDEELKVVEEFLTTCAKDGESDGENRCDKVKQIFKCFVDNSEKFGF